MKQAIIASCSPIRSQKIIPFTALNNVPFLSYKILKMHLRVLCLVTVDFSFFYIDFLIYEWQSYYV